MKTRRILIRVLAILALVALGAVMFVIGRGHTVYLDNKTLEYEGETYKAFYRVTVYKADGEKLTKLSARERGSDEVIGGSYKMTLEIIENKGDAEKYVECTLALPMNMDGVIINLPAYVAGLPEEAYMSEFIPAPIIETEPEETTDEFGMGDLGEPSDF